MKKFITALVALITQDVKKNKKLAYVMGVGLLVVLSGALYLGGQYLSEQPALDFWAHNLVLIDPDLARPDNISGGVYYGRPKAVADSIIHANINFFTTNYGTEAEVQIISSPVPHSHFFIIIIKPHYPKTAI